MSDSVICRTQNLLCGEAVDAMVVLSWAEWYFLQSAYRLTLKWNVAICSMTQLIRCLALKIHRFVQKIMLCVTKTLSNQEFTAT
jgi:hypothetical protein